MAERKDNPDTEGIGRFTGIIPGSRAGMTEEVIK